MNITAIPQHARPYATETPPYPPSWLDRLTRAVDAAPGSAWVYYVVAALIFVMIEMLIKWYDGTFPVGNVWLFYVIALSTAAYFVGLAHYLDRFAKQTFARFRPALDLDDAATAELHYRLTTLPARKTWIITAAAIVYGLVIAWGVAQGYFMAAATVFTSPLSVVYETGMSVVICIAMFVFFYHTAHQLRTISLILAACTTVNLFQQGPLYVFSRLTARTAMGWIAIGYAWIASEPNARADMLTVTTMAAVVTVGLVAFVWPLWGVHRILVEQKTRAIDGVTQRLRAALDELHQRIDQTRYDEVTPTVQAVNALRQELDLLEKIPTWPWRPETVRGVLTAVLLPVLLWFVTRALDRYIFL